MCVCSSYIREHPRYAYKCVDRIRGGGSSHFDPCFIAMAVQIVVSSDMCVIEARIIFFVQCKVHECVSGESDRRLQSVYRSNVV